MIDLVIPENAVGTSDMDSTLHTFSFVSAGGSVE